MKLIRAALVLVGCTVLSAAAVRHMRHNGDGRVREISGTIKELDVAGRVAVISIQHPKTGDVISVRGAIPPECEILIDGRAAELSALAVGDSGTVLGTVFGDGRVIPHRVRISREAPALPADLPSPGRNSMPPSSVGVHDTGASAEDRR